MFARTAVCEAAQLADPLLERADGRVFAGTTVYGGRVALRPAIVNWRTTQHDVDLFVDVVLELAEVIGLDQTGSGSASGT